jgi:REP element-mobilizing transposase RayT
MTNHLHLICRANRENQLSSIIRDFKRYTATKLLSEIRASRSESRKEWMLKLFGEAGDSSAKQNLQFWQRGYHPIEISSDKFFNQKLDYIHNNPVEGGFCYSAENYPYSSALWYSTRTGIIKMDELDVINS